MHNNHSSSIHNARAPHMQTEYGSRGDFGGGRTVHDLGHDRPDILDAFKENRDRERSESGGFWTQRQIQAMEHEIQLLNANKADLAGTSAQVTDSVFRFLGIRATKTVFYSLTSLFLASIIFILMYQHKNLAPISYFVFLLLIGHSFFPGYIIYRAKKYVLGEFFTGKYVRILKATWRSYEISFLMFTWFIYSIRNLDYEYYKAIIINKLVSLGIFGKMIAKYIAKISTDRINMSLNFLLITLLSSILLYMLMVYIANKRGTEEGEVLNIEHEQEQKRSAEIIRERARKGL